LNEHKPVEHYTKYYDDKYPTFVDENIGELPVGMYLDLFHGTEGDTRPDEMPEWGFEGPVIGPLKFVHTTYSDHITIHFEEEVDYSKYGFDNEEVTLYIRQDCIEYKGNLYGDWTVFNVKESKNVGLSRT
jgi:hypothetical protein